MLAYSISKSYLRSSYETKTEMSSQNKNQSYIGDALVKRSLQSKHLKINIILFMSIY